MTKRNRLTARWCVPIALVLVIVASSPLALKSEAADAGQIYTVSGVPVDAAISQMWRTADEPVATGSVVRGWLWGPQAIAAGVEYSEDSPSLRRTMVYFDKARLDILDPGAAQDSGWYVTGALLVAQMLAGEIPFGEDTIADRESPHIPVTGDLDQPGALTYAALGARASISGKPLRGGDAIAVPQSQAGQEIRDLIHGNGQVEAGVVSGNGITYGAYDEITGHNIAGPFADWLAVQQYPANYVIGRPLTEPYWVDSVVGGVPQQVLVQAFERRVLTYTPENAPDWRVESGNAGLHYRTWRGLSQPGDVDLLSLASLEPFGEEIVTAAVRHGVDPFLLAAIAQGASQGNPGASLEMGVGLMAVPVDQAARSSAASIDPARNTDLAARELARWFDSGGQPGAIIANYFSGGNPDWSSPTLSGLVDATLNAYAALRERHPVDFTPPAVEAPATSTPGQTAPAAPASTTGAFLGTGAAAYYSASYDVAWWQRTMHLYESWGSAVSGWQYDPNGYYCVHPAYRVGQRLHLSANGVTLTCTIGDAVASHHVSGWYAKWVVEMSWPTFKALGLDRNNVVTVHEAVQ